MESIEDSLMKKIIIEDFYNFEELKNAQHDLDDEKKTENFEMTEQELESIKMILNEREFEIATPGEESSLTKDIP